MFEAGDCDQPFTIQSISKPFTFGMALEEFGHEQVCQHVDVEPSGDAFNSIELQNGTNRPHNPMVNSGAITVTALLHERYGPETVRPAPRSLQRGRRPPARDGSRRSIESERRTGHRNRAIAHLLLNFGLMPDDAEAALDVYFRQCSILVTCRDLAMMGATLANMGRNPLTDEGVFDIHCVKRHAVDHVHLRHVRLLGTMGVPRRAFPPKAASPAASSRSSTARLASRRTHRGSTPTATAAAASKCARSWRRASAFTSSTA